MSSSGHITHTGYSTGIRCWRAIKMLIFLTHYYGYNELKLPKFAAASWYVGEIGEFWPNSKLFCSEIELLLHDYVLFKLDIVIICMPSCGFCHTT